MTKLNIAIIPVTPFQQNCTLIWNEETNEGVVIDPGGDVPQIKAGLEQTGISVKQILLTHGHLDHVGGAMELKEHLGVDIIGPHIDDKQICENVEEIASKYGLEGQFHNVTPDRWLSEGEKVEIGGSEFDVFHCPGHSPGHIVFSSPDHGFAHVGDVLFKGSVGRTDLPGGDHNQLITSIKTKLYPLGDHVGFICGHGPGSTIGEEKVSNPFLQ